MNNIYGIILSIGLTVMLLFLSTYLQKKHHLTEESSRKLIHISISNWWIIAIIFFDNWIIACIIPLIYIILNMISYQMKLVKAMERTTNNHLGTIYFPISLLVLVIMFFGIWNEPYIGAIGVLIMGYGDGFAGLIGGKYGKKKIVENKTIIGSISMFIFSLSVSIVLLSIYNPSVWTIEIAFVLAIIATLLEMFSKHGLDNLTVPIVTSTLYFLFTLL
jgi:phytol kinase